MLLTIVNHYSNVIMLRESYSYISGSCCSDFDGPIVDFWHSSWWPVVVVVSGRSVKRSVGGSQKFKCLLDSDWSKPRHGKFPSASVSVSVGIIDTPYSLPVAEEVVRVVLA